MPYTLGRNSYLGLAAAGFLAAGAFMLRPDPAAAQATDCISPKWDVAGCQPAPFDVLAVNIPTARFNETGQIDPTATEEEVRAGAKYLDETLGLSRNFELLHWVTLNPSTFNEQTGQWEGGGFDSRDDGRALTIAGRCLYAGHANRGGGESPLEIFRIQDDPVANAPVHVGQIPVPQPGTDDSIMSARYYTKANGQDTIILLRDISTDEGGLWTYEMDPDTCLMVKEAQAYDWGGDMHEMGMWIDPANPLRTLIVGGASGGAGNPDPYREGFLTPDIRVLAVTDETTGELLDHPIPLAHFTLQDVSDKIRGETPDENGWFTDGRYPDYEHVINYTGTRLSNPNRQNNVVHQTVWSADGRRVYVAGGVAGFYILDSSAIVDNTDAVLAAKNAGCNWESSSIWADGVAGGQIDSSKLMDPAGDCLHMVIYNEPSMRAAADRGDIVQFLRFLDRSRFDAFPGHRPNTGIHTAVEIPNRPSNDRTNVLEDGTLGPRAKYVFLTSETFTCPGSHVYLVNIEVEAAPSITNTFGVAANDVEHCITIPTEHADGSPRRLPSWMAHNPTAFENLVVMSWYGHGIRAIDISNAHNMREVGHAVTAPLGQDRSYPVFYEGLVYWVNNRNGMHVARYTGPYADQIPTDVVVAGNDVHHQ